MSNLADLLNPAPSSGGSKTNSSPPKPTVNTSNQPQSHRRNESITSPLEALAIAATTNNSYTASQSRSAASFPPNPYLNTNPYAIKPNHSPPAARPASRPQAASPQPSSMERAPNDSSSPKIQSSPAASATSLMSPHSKQESVQPVVKTELSDDSAVKSDSATDAVLVKKEESTPAPKPPSEDSEMKDASLMDTKPKEIKKPIAATKKGMAKAKKDTGDSTGMSRKQPVKKRKLEPESKDGTPFSQRSGTPNSRTSKTPASKRTPQQSPGPQSTGNDEEDYDGASDEDNEVFCICRRPDDHTWMIACDGGCDDWFHGTCVKVDEADGALIDKYICPNCEAANRGRTMWKPMCRLPGCREPARVTGKKPSKYCSDEHGRQFMRDKAMGKTGKGSKGEEARKRRKASRADHIGNESNDTTLLNGEDSDDGHQAHLRGGVLKQGELKALATGVKDVHEFKRLGERLTTTDVRDEAKATAQDGANGDVKMEDGDTDLEPAAPKLNFTDQEQAALDSARKKRSSLNAKLALLADRDRLLAMVKTRHKSVLEELRKKDKGIKDVCGYDPRLIWTDEEFREWRNSEEGKAALESQTLPPPPKRRAEETNGDGGNADETEEIGRGVCKRKRCERHKTWAKLEQQEINLARSQCWHQMRKIDRDEEELRERAMMRQREAR